MITGGGLKERLGLLPEAISQKLQTYPVIWIQAASAGETLASRPLLKKLKKQYPDHKILFSTMTATGRQLAREQLAEIDALIYFPLDISWIVRKLIRQFNPVLIITIETELWPNFIREADRNNCSVMVVSGRISEKSYQRYQYLKPLVKKNVISN